MQQLQKLLKVLQCQIRIDIASNPRACCVAKIIRSPAKPHSIALNCFLKLFVLLIN